jgi:hypothetical protein
MTSASSNTALSNTERRSPPARDVADFHKFSDKNVSTGALHHTIGMGANEVAPGRHYHNGSDSPTLLEDFTITGSRSGATANVLQQILIALAAVGLKDSTTP